MATMTAGSENLDMDRISLQQASRGRPQRGDPSLASVTVSNAPTAAESAALLRRLESESGITRTADGRIVRVESEADIVREFLCRCYVQNGGKMKQPRCST